MDLFEGGDEGFVVVGSVGVGERVACAEFFEQVVHAGDGDFGVGGLDLFAVGVEAIIRLTSSVVSILLCCRKSPHRGKTQYPE